MVVVYLDVSNKINPIIVITSVKAKQYGSSLPFHVIISIFVAQVDNTTTINKLIFLCVMCYYLFSFFPIIRI